MNTPLSTARLAEIQAQVEWITRNLLLAAVADLQVEADRLRTPTAPAQAVAHALCMEMAERMRAIGVHTSAHFDTGLELIAAELSCRDERINQLCAEQERLRELVSVLLCAPEPEFGDVTSAVVALVDTESGRVLARHCLRLEQALRESLASPVRRVEVEYPIARDTASNVQVLELMTGREVATEFHRTSDGVTHQGRLKTETCCQ